MTSYRDLALREMGLAPLWVPRRAPQGAVSAAAALDAPAAAQPASAARQQRIAALDWEPLRDAVVTCVDCGLCTGRRNAVFGAGQADAPWMLVGEAPGEEEDEHGLPFVGPSGKLLDNMLAAIGLSRDQETFITNVVKCRPPGSTRPEPAAISACTPYLMRQIELVRPRVIVALGAVAAAALLDSDAPVGSLRGRAHVRRFGDRDIPVVVLFHPAYLLRKLSEKSKAWADLCLARETMAALS